MRLIVKESQYKSIIKEQQSTTQTIKEWSRYIMDKMLLNVSLTDEEIIKRKKDWKPRTTNHNSGSIWKYAQTVGPAYEGAVTQPGAKDETHTYADI